MSQQYYTDNQDSTIALKEGTCEGTNMNWLCSDGPARELEDNTGKCAEMESTTA